MAHVAQCVVAYGFVLTENYLLFVLYNNAITDADEW